MFCLGFKPLTQKKEKKVRKKNPGMCAAVSRWCQAASAQETMSLLPLDLLLIEKEKLKTQNLVGFRNLRWICISVYGHHRI